MVDEVWYSREGFDMQTIGGLNLVVRFEVDACMPEEESTTSTVELQPVKEQDHSVEEVVPQANPASTPKVTSPSEEGTAPTKEQPVAETSIDETNLWGDPIDDPSAWGADPVPVATASATTPFDAGATKRSLQFS